jgi:hypothetical protein
MVRNLNGTVDCTNFKQKARQWCIPGKPKALGTIYLVHFSGNSLGG